MPPPPHSASASSVRSQVPTGPSALQAKRKVTQHLIQLEHSMITYYVSIQCSHTTYTYQEQAAMPPPPHSASTSSVRSQVPTGPSAHEAKRKVTTQLIQWQHTVITLYVTIVCSLTTYTYQVPAAVPPHSASASSTQSQVPFTTQCGYFHRTPNLST